MSKPLNKYNELCDEKLLELYCSDCDQLAFLALYLRYESKLMAYFLKVSKNESLSKDLLQETYTNLLHSRLFNENSINEFGNYLVRIAHNSWSAYLKREKKLNEQMSEWQAAQENSLKSTDELQKEKENERNSIIKQAVNQLPPRQKEAISLWSYSYSYVQIANMMNATIKEVTGLIYRAKQNLGRML